MAEVSWPAPTPRDEVLARVVTRGRRIQMLNRLAIGGVALATAATVSVGVWLGVSGAVDLVGDEGSTPAVVTPQGGDGSDGGSAGAVAYFACPNERELGELHGGDRVYLTGRDGSGDWVELRSPLDAAIPVWVRAEVVDPDGDADLPEVDCDLTELALGVTPTSTTVPEETTTTTEADDDPTTPTTTRPTTPTQPPVTPTTTPQTTTTLPAADTTGPSISSLSRTNPIITEYVFEFCDTGNTTEVSAVVSDPSGVASVEARWSFSADGVLQSGAQSMSLSGGRYRTVLEFTGIPGLSWGEVADINWSVRAVDVHGNSRTVSSGPNNSVELRGC